MIASSTKARHDMTKVLIGVDGSDRSEDAVAFGRAPALAAGAPVVLSTAHQTEPRQPRLDGAPAHAGLREEAEAMLARLALMLLDVEDVERRLLADHSPARALRAAAEQTGAGIIVVGSSHVGRFGRVLPGSTAERLLHGAPCPVAVVPVGFGAHGLPEHPVIGCGYEATDYGAAALGAAEELALAVRGSLQVTHVVEPPSYLYDSGEMPLNMPELDGPARRRVRTAHPLGRVPRDRRPPGSPVDHRLAVRSVRRGGLRLSGTGPIRVRRARGGSHSASARRG